MANYDKWVAMWGNAVSISENRPEAYARNITLRYKIFCPFDGDAVRLTFDNYCGTEGINIAKTTLMLDGRIIPASFSQHNGKTEGEAEAGTKTLDAGSVHIPAGEHAVSDAVGISVRRGMTLYVSFYLEDYTQMRSSVFVKGPYSGGQYALGDCTEAEEFDIDISRKTNICYFLSNISIHTEEANRAVVCYGDSITAQDWPDYLLDKLIKNNIDNISVIRRATSGSRILRQYSCITYESYGLKGENRFEHEVPTDGADTVIIQQGINDIIHPVGTDVNPFRPMSDLPTAAELEAGLEMYIGAAKRMGLKVVLGTLLPIEGWRTYADFREKLKNEFNDHMRNNAEADGLIDFDRAVRDTENPKAFAAGYDSGDHLHPSSAGYEAMAEAAFEYLTGSR